MCIVVTEGRRRSRGGGLRGSAGVGSGGRRRGKESGFGGGRRRKTTIHVYIGVGTRCFVDGSHQQQAKSITKDVQQQGQGRQRSSPPACSSQGKSTLTLDLRKMAPYLLFLPQRALGGILTRAKRPSCVSLDSINMPPFFEFLFLFWGGPHLR